ncbi:MAG: hypothetical protein INQ03_20130 [Candidatus Heimdallarchaeota archaeon]|nr:hypothetical protein [Candidatus Heimdallarchaeota archaeon]
MTILIFDEQNYDIWKDPLTYQEASNNLYKFNFTTPQDYSVNLNKGLYFMIIYNMWGVNSIIVDIFLTITETIDTNLLIQIGLFSIIMIFPLLGSIRRMLISRTAEDSSTYQEYNQFSEKSCRNCYSRIEDGKECPNCGQRY